jgi:hypothetical protein
MRKTLLMAVPLIISITALAQSRALAEGQTTDTTVPQAAEAQVEQVVFTRPYEVSSLGKTKHAKVSLDFWDELARCETGGNWKNGGNWAGGLGIALSTWQGYGGTEFAKRPNHATKEEQIIVATRVALTGYQTKNVFLKLEDIPNKPFFRPAVGFGGWGALPCAGGRPEMFRYDRPSLLLHSRFTMGQKGTAVAELQMVLRTRINGVYDKNTRAKHLSKLQRMGEKTTGVPPLKKQKTTIAEVHASSVSTAAVKKTCPQYEKLMKKYGLPVESFTYIMWRESRCQSKAIGWNYKSGYGPSNCKLSPATTYKKCAAVRSYDSGLLQINSSWKTVTAQVCKSKFGDLTVLLNAECNLKVASFLFEEGGGISNWKATSGS